MVINNNKNNDVKDSDTLLDNTFSADKDKFPFSPEEIQKEFETFVKNKFGDKIQVFTQPLAPQRYNVFENEQKEEDSNKFDLNFNLKPKDIKEYLDRFVIKQDEAKKALAIAVCDHYNYVKCLKQNPHLKGKEYSKQNILILGPTGVGKTYLIKQIAKLIGVPFVKADATKFSETGYVGANVEDLIRDLVNQADGDIDIAQYGIIYLDEADKLATSSNMMGRDVSGRGVQFGLLKLMEETDVDLRASHDITSQIQAFMEFQKTGKVGKHLINTRHILFIISGAFNNLVDIVKARLNQNVIGFSADIKKLASDEDYLEYANTKDFIDFGFEPEFIGRLPIRVVCKSLNEDDLYNILKNSEGSLIKQYIQAFKAYGIDVYFSDEALHLIAKLAYQEKTGARALMTICEKILRDYKFELPSFPNINAFVVNEQVVLHPKEELHQILQDDLYNQRNIIKEQIILFEQNFFKKFNLQIEFSDEAKEKIIDNILSNKVNVQEFLENLLQNYEHGLKLIEQNIGTNKFILPVEIIDNSQMLLEKWTQESYKNKK